MGPCFSNVPDKDIKVMKLQIQHTYTYVGVCNFAFNIEIVIVYGKQQLGFHKDV